jgi:hypothetical protein
VQGFGAFALSDSIRVWRRSTANAKPVEMGMGPASPTPDEEIEAKRNLMTKDNRTWGQERGRSKHN